MDLTTYRRRVGLADDLPLPPTLTTLRTLTWHHVTHIPFENVDVQLGRPISLEVADLERKLVGARRGGYCFEHNTWFEAVLRELGYSVTALAARVRWNAIGPTPRTHMLLRVELEGGGWLVDVGFGGFVPTGPLRLADDEVQPLRFGTFRIVRAADGARTLQAELEGGYSDLYRFTDEPHQRVDFEVMNHFTSTHPASRFRRSLIVTSVGEDGRHALMNDEHTHRAPERTHKRKLAASEIPSLLRTVFSLDVADGTRFPALESS